MQTGPGYKVFVFLLDHWLKIFCGWFIFALFVGIVGHEPRFFVLAALLPLVLLAGAGTLIFVFAALSRIVVRLLR